MAPILGIWASSITPSLQNSYESISTVTVGAGGTSTITFSSIPSTYQHLQLRAIAACNQAGTDFRPSLQINSDTGANYANHQIYFDGGSAASQGFTSSTVIDRLGYMPGSSSLANTFGTFIMDFADYSNTSKYKTIRSLNGHEENSAGKYSAYASGLWMNTSAISTLTFTVAGGGNFIQNTQFALYGIKG
jgi:hypothetical protein